MKILAPLNDLNYLEPFMEAGADEFFMGFYEEKDEERFGRYFELNRMSGFRRNSSRFTFDEMLRATELIKSKGKEVYITFNSSGYSEEALQYMEKYVRALVDAGADGMIVSCIEAMDMVERMGGKSVISGIGAVYNENTARFYQKHGAKRIIVPRDLTMQEIAEIKKAVPDMEFETFIMRNGCLLSDANCLGLHLDKHGGICLSIKKSEKVFHVSEKKRMEMKKTQELFDTCLYRTACGLCAIYSMLQADVTACKVVGRLDNHEKVFDDIKLVRDNIEIAKSSSSEEEYMSNMIFPDNSENICSRGYSCYFPEIVNKRVRLE